MARMIDAERLLRELTALSHGQVWPGWTYDGIRLLIERQPTLTPPNEPLTLEELREMDEEPVYVVPKDKPAHCGGWCGVTVWKCDRYSYVSLLRDADSGWGFEKYGKTWIAYRRPPEGEEEEKHVIEITENL